MAPSVELDHLDELWFQVAGTLCNLTCRHCFISCSPHNDAFGFLSLDDVLRRLDESVALGVKEYYFTGGEPFLNPQLVPMLAATLRYGPATVLTNATVLRDDWLAELAAAEAAGIYSLEFRVSIDGWSPETNDPVRGEGTFERALRGLRMLLAHGFLPIVTAARTWSEEIDQEATAQFVAMLRGVGYARPRLKLLPALRLGAEAGRCRGYFAEERVTVEMFRDYDRGQLLCSRGRTVSDRGVHVCPILLDSPDSLLGPSLLEASRPFAVSHGACFTCWQYGSICSNPSVGQVAKLPLEIGQVGNLPHERRP